MHQSAWVVRSCRALLGAGLVLALCATPAAAQDTGTVSGTVVDTSSQVVPGATVTLVNGQKLFLANNEWRVTTKPANFT